MKRARTITTVIAAIATATLAATFALVAPIQSIFTDDTFAVTDTAFEAVVEETDAETVVTDSSAQVAPIADTSASTADTADAEEAAETIEEAEVPAASDAGAQATAGSSDLAVPRTGESTVRNYQPIMENRSINVGGHIIGYVDYYEQPAAPARGAGLWLGEDSTTDGTWGYFIGHNPGDFSGVMDLTEGDAVTVCDSEGLFRTYYVHDAFFVTTETTWQDIESRVTGFGESIILQTCVGDNAHYRVVVAY